MRRPRWWSPGAPWFLLLAIFLLLWTGAGYYLLPGYSFVAAPVRWVLFAVSAVGAVLLALGLSDVVRSAEWRERAGVAGCLALVLYVVAAVAFVLWFR